MSDFGPAIEVVLRNEGGWVDDPDDPGGETNFGISHRMVASEGLTAADLGLPNLDRGAMKAMTVETARVLYRRFFWDKYGYGGIKDQLVATKVFDCAVNCGPRRAAILAQQATIVCGQWAVVDGVLGPKTLEAINACNPTLFLRTLAEEMASYYRSLTVKWPRLIKFLGNWLKRSAWPGLTLQPPKGTQ